MKRPHSASTNEQQLRPNKSLDWSLPAFFAFRTSLKLKPWANSNFPTWFYGLDDGPPVGIQKVEPHTTVEFVSVSLKLASISTDRCDRVIECPDFSWRTSLTLVFSAREIRAGAWDLWVNFVFLDLGVEPKLGEKTQKMDGENNGKPYENGWYGGTTIFGNTYLFFFGSVPAVRCSATLVGVKWWESILSPPKKNM